MNSYIKGARTSGFQNKTVSHSQPVQMAKDSHSEKKFQSKDQTPGNTLRSIAKISVRLKEMLYKIF